MFRAATVAVLIFGLGVDFAAGQGREEVTQWRGANRDGVAGGFKVPSTWPEQLTRRWKIEVGEGYATPLVIGNRVYMFSREGDDEVMRGIDAATGKVLWRTAYPAPFTMHSSATPHGKGPKSTPVFADGRLFAIGMTGTVTAFDAKTGKQLWQKPGSEPVPLYTTHAFSPVIDRGHVIFHLGGHDKGALTALDMKSGTVKWSWSGDGPGYGSPIVADFGGVRQVVTITQGKVVGVDATTGVLLWERPFPSKLAINSITPIRYGQSIIVWGRDVAGDPVTALSIAKRNDQWAVETIWENPDVTGRNSDAVLDGDVMFGLTTRNSGQYYALEVKTGKTLWTSDGRQANKVALARSGNTILSLENDGELVVLRASRTGFEPIRRYKVGDTDTWAAPALSGNRILVKDVASLSLWTVN